ncbi:MAG: hypothetical protein JTT11_04230 [Candidatus Brockarchaeota archaeon]|nr:hypothetical protein [Candidatus Brockarchaeota archaeon]
MPCRSIRITDPIDGAILNRHDGKQAKGGLEIAVKGIAPWKSKVTVNGVEAKVSRDGCGFCDRFECNIVLEERVNGIAARAESGQGASSDEITVYWDKDSFKRYRFSTDDNILFLKDLAANAQKYSSIFDNGYMAFWREMHDKYGLKVQFNIYYQTEGFNLSQMPDKFKPEWKENSDWIRLTFHALQNDPPNPYVKASYQEVLRDFNLVTKEIARFAGKELLSPFTTIHWGEATLEGCKALRDSGIIGLVGYFVLNSDIGKPVVSYYLDEEKTRYLGGRDYWKDTKAGLFFIKHDLVINLVEPEDIGPTLDSIASNPHRSELMEVMIHEQYFHPELELYEPDAKERVVATLDWLAKNGYKSIFYEEGFLGA